MPIPASAIAVNMVRTVKVLERAGAAGLQIEDQVFPKKCGHFDGKAVVPLEEMLAKIKAAVDTRKDGDLQIVARTDARAILGLQAAIDRAGAMIEAGADVTFVEAPTSADELAQIAQKPFGPAGRQHRVRRPDAGTGAAKICRTRLRLRALRQRRLAGGAQGLA